MFRTIPDILDRALTFSCILAAITIGLMAVMGAADAVTGALYSTPIAGTQELSQILLPTAFFLALGKVQQKREHIEVDIITNMMTPRVRRIFVRFGTLFGTVVLGIIAWRLWINALDALHILQRANAGVHIPVYPFKILSAIGVTLAAMECLRQTLQPAAIETSPRDILDTEVQV